MSKGGPIPPEDSCEALEWFASKLLLMRNEAKGDDFRFGVYVSKLCQEVNDYDREYIAKMSCKTRTAYLIPRPRKKPKLEIVK